MYIKKIGFYWQSYDKTGHKESQKGRLPLTILHSDDKSS